MRRFDYRLRGSGFSAFLGVRVSLLLVVQVVGAPSLCAGEGVWDACQLANLPTFRLVGLLDCWRVVVTGERWFCGE